MDSTCAYVINIMVVLTIFPIILQTDINVIMLYWRTGDFAQGLTYLHCPLKKDWLILTPEYRMTTTVKPNRV